MTDSRSNAELVQKLRAAKIIASPRVYEAMLATDRALYTASDGAYEDAPQGIPGTTATISAPHMHAHSLEQLSPFLRTGGRVLDVGCGSGYLTACLARMVGETGTVVGIDHLDRLTALARANLRQDDDDPSLKSIGIVTGDGWRGHEPAAPYDAIHVGAAATSVPEALVAQLARPGRMVVPVGPAGGDQFVMLVDKDERGNVTIQKTFGVRYVPLVDVAAP